MLPNKDKSGKVSVVELREESYSVVTSYRIRMPKNQLLKCKCLWPGAVSTTTYSSLGTASLTWDEKRKEDSHTPFVSRNVRPKIKKTDANPKFLEHVAVSAAQLKGVAFRLIPLSGRWKKMFCRKSKNPDASTPTNLFSPPFLNRGYLLTTPCAILKSYSLLDYFKVRNSFFCFHGEQVGTRREF